MSNPSVLLAEDEPLTQEMMREQLQLCGALVDIAEDGAVAQKKLRECSYDAAFLDLEMPRASGVDCLRVAQEVRPELSVVIVSAVGEINDAVEAMKLGACDYLAKPCSTDELQRSLQRAVKATRLALENQGLREAIDTPKTTVEFVARSNASLALLDRLERIAEIDSTVLLTGPSGSGKTLIARKLHEMSDRAAYPFVAVNCASLPRDLIESELFGHTRGAFTGAEHDRPGRAEMADTGTLFLDEIGELPIELQPKLLTFLQDRECQRIGSNEPRTVDVRLIAATNRDLLAHCKEGLFREDLYYRLDVIALEMPALCDRLEDIIPLAESILQRIAVRRAREPAELDGDAKKLILSSDWPGNVRQLENALERASAFCTNSVIRAHDLNHLHATNDKRSRGFSSFENRTLEEIEIEAIRQALTSTEGNQAEAARRLGVSEKTIYNKIRKHELLAEVVRK